MMTIIAQILTMILTTITNIYRLTLDYFIYIIMCWVIIRLTKDMVTSHKQKNSTKELANKYGNQ